MTEVRAEDLMRQAYLSTDLPVTLEPTPGKEGCWELVADKVARLTLWDEHDESLKPPDDPFWGMSYRAERWVEAEGEGEGWVEDDTDSIYRTEIFEAEQMIDNWLHDVGALLDAGRGEEG